MKYITREVTAYVYNLVNAEKDATGNSVVTKSTTITTYNKLGQRALHKYMAANGYNAVVGIDEIKENDFNLNIPRYVDTFEEEEEIDLAAVKAEIADLELQLQEVQAQMQDYLEELGA